MNNNNKIYAYTLLTNESIVPEDMRDKMFDAMRSFVAETARGARRERIYRARLEDIEPCGILRRLWVEYLPTFPGFEVGYDCGQEWNSEMSVLRNIFDPKNKRK